MTTQTALLICRLVEWMLLGQIRASTCIEIRVTCTDKTTGFMGLLHYNQECLDGESNARTRASALRRIQSGPERHINIRIQRVALSHKRVPSGRSPHHQPSHFEILIASQSATERSPLVTSGFQTLQWLITLEFFLNVSVLGRHQATRGLKHTIA